MIGLGQALTTLTVVCGCTAVVVLLASVARHIGQHDLTARHGHKNHQLSSASKYRDTRPNFIILFADDIGWGDLGANWNRESSNTPNLDRLADQGIRFTDFHSGAPVCTPSRASLLTARLGLRTGVVSNFGPHSIEGLPLNETTFAETFHESGYRTGVIGKWHLGTNGHHHPNHRGFDYFFGLPASNDMGCVDKPGANIPLCNPCPDSDTKQCLAQDIKRIPCHEDYALPLMENRNILEQPTDLFTLAHKCTRKATEFILDSNDDDRPFLLYMAFTHMHVPLTHASKFNNASVGGGGLYADSLREMDYMVGEIVDAVHRSNKETNTLVWFTGDNGPWDIKCQLAGDRGPFLGSWQHTQGGGGASAKSTIWEAGHREPSLAYWPGHISPGQVTDSILSAMDIYPTMAAIADVAMPPNRKYDGVDISDVLFNSKVIHGRTLFHPNGLIGDVHGRLDGVRMGKYKALYLTGGKEGCGEPSGPIIEHDPPLIFNLDLDPAENKDLDQSTEEYQLVSVLIQNALRGIMDDISTDNTTITNYDTDTSVRPCCNPDSSVCRCENQE